MSRLATQKSEPAPGSAPDAEPNTALGELRAHWTTLAGATLGVAFGASALPFYTSGLFLVQFQHDFGWSRTALTGIGLAVTLLAAGLAPVAGAVFDRIGVRLPAAIGFVALAVSFLALSRLSGSLLQYGLLQVATTALTLGVTPISLTRPVNMAFHRMRGLALGVTIGGIGATAAFAPPLVGRMIASYGWRATYQDLGIAVLVMAPLSLALLSRRGPTAPAGDNHLGSQPENVSILRSGLFWRLIAGFTLIALAVAGFVTHFVPMLVDGGTPFLAASRIAGLLGVAVLLGRLLVGLVLDRLFAPFVAAGLLALSASGIAVLAIGGAPFAAAGAFAVGLALGAEVDLIAYLTARYYGMRRYGRMYGLLYGAFVVGTGVSPYLISLVQAAAHSYAPALWTSAGLLAAAAMLFATAPRFQEPGESRLKPALCAIARRGPPSLRRDGMSHPLAIAPARLNALVTALDADGRSIVGRSGPPGATYAWPDGGGLYEICTEPAGPMRRREAAGTPAAPVKLCPEAGAIKVRWFTIVPSSQPPQSPEEVEKVVAAGFAELGATAVRRDTRRHVAMHLTDTFDVITVVEGRVRLLLDEGDQILGPGDVVVQRGTNHAWVCEGETPVVMVAVLVSREFAEAAHDA